MKNNNHAKVVFYLCFNLVIINSVYLFADNTNTLQDDYNQLANLHLPSLVKQEADELEEKIKINKYNKKLHQKKLVDFFKKPTNLKVPILGICEKLKALYKIFSTKAEASEIKTNKIIGLDLLNDLEFYCGNKNDLEHHLFAILDNTQTCMGKIQLQKMLLNSTIDIIKLKQRQKIIKRLIEDKSLFNSLTENFNKIKETESDFIWFWKELDEELEKNLNIPYFGKLSNVLNKSDFALEISDWLITILKPITYAGFIVGIQNLGLYFAYKFAPLSTRLTIHGIANSIYLFFGKATIDQMQINNSICNIIQRKMINVATVANNMLEIAQIIESDNILAKKIPSVRKILNLPAKNKKIETFLEKLKSNTFKEYPSFFSYRGKALVAFKTMQEIKNDFIKSMKIIGKIDAYLSIAKLYKKYSNNKNIKFCFPKYVKKKTPYLNISEFWHPILDANKVVTNSIELGQSSKASNIVLTGPNAAGKSTILKSI